MDIRRKWFYAKSLRKVIVLIKIIDPRTREKLFHREFVIPEEKEKLYEVLEAML